MFHCNIQSLYSVKTTAAGSETAYLYIIKCLDCTREWNFWKVFKNIWIDSKVHFHRIFIACLVTQLAFQQMILHQLFIQSDLIRHVLADTVFNLFWFTKCWENVGYHVWLVCLFIYTQHYIWTLKLWTKFST